MEPIPLPPSPADSHLAAQQQWVEARRHVHTCPPCHAYVTQARRTLQAADLWDREEYDQAAGAVMAAYVIHQGLIRCTGEFNANTLLAAGFQQ